MAITNITITNLQSLTTNIGNLGGNYIKNVSLAILTRVCSKVLIEHLRQTDENWIIIEEVINSSEGPIEKYAARFRRSDSAVSFMLLSGLNTGVDVSFENNSVFVPSLTSTMIGNAGRLYSFSSMPLEIRLRILHSVDNNTIAIGLGTSSYENFTLAYGKNIDGSHIVISNGTVGTSSDTSEGLVLSSSSTKLYAVRPAEIVSGSIDKFINFPDDFSETYAESIYTALNLDTLFLKENFIRNNEKFIAFNQSSTGNPNSYKPTLAIPVESFVASHKTVDATNYISTN